MWPAATVLKPVIPSAYNIKPPPLSHTSAKCMATVQYRLLWCSQNGTIPGEQTRDEWWSRWEVGCGGPYIFFIASLKESIKRQIRNKGVVNEETPTDVCSIKNPLCVHLLCLILCPDSLGHLVLTYCQRESVSWWCSHYLNERCLSLNNNICTMLLSESELIITWKRRRHDTQDSD